MYCLYVRFDYTYIDINALAQGIKSFLASQVWFQAVAGARTYGTDLPTITSQPQATETCMYVLMYVCMYIYICMYTYIYTYIYTHTNTYIHKDTHTSILQGTFSSVVLCNL